MAADAKFRRSVLEASVLKVSQDSLEHDYRQYWMCALGLACAAVLWAIGTPGVGRAVLLAAAVASGACGARVKSRLALCRVTIDDAGIEVVGVWRGYRVPWTDVRYCGWLVTPRLGRELQFPMFKVRGRRRPLVIWVCDRTLARDEGVRPAQIHTRLEHGARPRGVEYHPRTPSLGTRAYAATCAMVTWCVAVSLALVWGR